MKVSTRVECGILALTDIAMHQSEGKPVTVSSISSRQSNLVRSTKGFKGGYVLTRPAKEISLRTVIDALDVTVLADVHFQEESETPLKTIVNHQLWNPMTTYLRKFCDSITISDMMEQYRTFLIRSVPLHSHPQSSWKKCLIIKQLDLHIPELAIRP